MKTLRTLAILGMGLWVGAIFYVAAFAAEPARISKVPQALADVTMTHTADPAYARCHMDVPEQDRSVSPYAQMSGETLSVLTHSPGHPMQGCAAWHSSARHSATADSTGTGKWQALVAAEALDSPEPVLSLWRTEAIDMGYVVWAARRWPERLYLHKLTAHLDAEERADAEDMADVIETFAAQARELVR